MSIPHVALHMHTGSISCRSSLRGAVEELRPCYVRNVPQKTLSFKLKRREMHIYIYTLHVCICTYTYVYVYICITHIFMKNYTNE